MPTTDELLQQIGTALDDWSISEDAMRSAPDRPDLAAVHPGASGATILVRRLVERHGLSQQEARAAVLAAELGQRTEPALLAAREAQAALREAVGQLREAFAPIAKNIAAMIQTLKQALPTAPEATRHGQRHPARPYGRPAWQSPYGPRTRRR